MKIEKKKALAARTLGVGEGRIVFNKERLSELKDAITKQDIKDLKTSGVIIIKEIRGRKKVQKRKTRRRAGSFKKKVNAKKQKYVKLTRKLRAHLSMSKSRERINNEDFTNLRKEVRANNFRSLAHLKERVSLLTPEGRTEKNAKNNKTKKKRKKN